MNEQNGKQKWGRSLEGGVMILCSVAVSAVVGLMFAVIFVICDGGNFLAAWFDISVGLLALLGGYPFGGLLMMVFRKWDEKFCTKAGHILWYGTTFGGYALSRILKFEPGIGIFIAAFVISAIVCAILKNWGEHGEGKEAAKDFIILVLALVAVAYMLNIRGDNLDKISAAEKEQETYDIAYDDGYQQGREDQEAADWEKLTIEGKSIVDIVDLVSDHYGMTPQEAWGVIEEYNYDGTHGGFTWEEYMDAMEAAVATAMYFPPME